MDILQSLCSTPTAPFAEGAVVRYVEAFVKRRRKLRLSRDAFGNLLIELPAVSKTPRWVFAAHIDHPGFVAREMVDARTLRADFHGWVGIDYVRGTKVRFFDGPREITGVVTEATPDEHDRLEVPSAVLVRVNGGVAPGSPGMFDQGVGRVKGRRFYSRVCDDLAGAAACLAMLDALCKSPPEVTVAVLLTRAEEEGFIGCIAACLHPTLLKKTDRLVAIECSAEQPFAPLGKGAIIRVGDKTSVFDSGLSYFLTHQAGLLKKADESFQYQRALMPGGTCEATVYDIYGYTAASICVPLGNYHNMDKAKKKIGPEYIDLSDWRNMVKLFVHLAKTGHEYEPGRKLLKERVVKRFRKYEKLLATGRDE